MSKCVNIETNTLEHLGRRNQAAYLYSPRCGPVHWRDCRREGWVHRRDGGLTTNRVDTVADHILRSLDTLTPAETRVARAILASYPASGLKSASAIAEAARTSPGTVIRFINKIGLEGLPQVHDALRAEISHRLGSPFQTFAPDPLGSEFVDAIKRTEIGLINETLARLTPEVLESVRHLLGRSSTLWILGGTFSQAVALYLYEHLHVLRSGVRFLDARPAPIPDQLVQVGRSDCLVVFDFRRYESLATFAARYVKGKRAHVVAVTDHYLSPASHYADHTLIVPVESELLLDSYTGAMALVDVLVSDLVASDRTVLERAGLVEEARGLLAQMLAGEGDGLPTYNGDPDGDSREPGTG